MSSLRNVGAISPSPLRVAWRVPVPLRARRIGGSWAVARGQTRILWDLEGPPFRRWYCTGAYHGSHSLRFRRRLAVVDPRALCARLRGRHQRQSGGGGRGARHVQDPRSRNAEGRRCRTRCGRWRRRARREHRRRRAMQRCVSASRWIHGMRRVQSRVVRRHGVLPGGIAVLLSRDGLDRCMLRGGLGLHGYLSHSGTSGQSPSNESCTPPRSLMLQKPSAASAQLMPEASA
jgi:hypothetical protein